MDKFIIFTYEMASITVPPHQLWQVRAYLDRLSLEEAGNSEGPVPEGPVSVDTAGITRSRIGTSSIEYLVGGEWVPYTRLPPQEIKEYARSRGEKIVWIYCRVSTKVQASGTYAGRDTGPHTSLADQHRIIEMYIMKHLPGVHPVVVYDSRSAYTSISKALRDTVKEANSGESIVVYRTDRFSRNLVKVASIIGELESRGVDIVSANEDITLLKDRARFVTAIMAGEADSRAIRDRILSSIARRKGANTYVKSTAKYGLKKVKVGDSVRYVQNKQEMGVILKVKRKLPNSLKGRERSQVVRMIQEELNGEGITKRGKIWNERMVRDLSKWKE